MESDTSESGLEELLRLSRSVAKTADTIAKQEARKKEELATKTAAIQGFREITFSTTLAQLKTVSAEADILNQVSSLKTSQGTEDLRKLIVDLMSELDGKISKMSRSNPELAPIEISINTLSVLIDLFFSLN